MDKLAQGSKGGVYQLPHAHVDGAELDHELFRFENSGGEPGAPCPAGRRGAGPGGSGRDFAQAVSDELVPRVMLAAERTGHNIIAAAGGVAANSVIRADLERACAQRG